MKEHIRQSNLIEGIDDPKEDEQSLKAWEWLKEIKELDHTVICALQFQIVENQTDLMADEKGDYRNINVYVGTRLCPSAFFVNDLMSEWLDDFKPDLSTGVSQFDPIENHVKFELIHPFVDGNGRTGRMLLWHQEIKEGKEPTLFKADERQEYYKLFKE